MTWQLIALAMLIYLVVCPLVVLITGRIGRYNDEGKL